MRAAPETQALYDALGRMTTQIDALGHVTTTLYDALGRATIRMCSRKPSNTPAR